MGDAGKQKPKVAKAVEEITTTGRACWERRRPLVQEVIAALRENQPVEAFGADIYGLGLPGEPLTFAVGWAPVPSLMALAR